jgi:hypothetical protein
MTIPEAKQNPVMTRLPMSPKTWHVPSHQKCKDKEHVFVTNEDEILPIKAITQQKYRKKARVDDGQTRSYASSYLLKRQGRTRPRSEKIGETSNPQKNMTEGQSSRHEEIGQSEDDQVA